MDFAAIKQASANYLPEMSKFLRELIAIPGESCGEEAVIRRIAAEMEQVGFDEVIIDPMGNVLGYMGTGEHLLAYDAHIDRIRNLRRVIFNQCQRFSVEQTWKNIHQPDSKQRDA